VKTLSIISNSLAETLSLGKNIGKVCRGGEVFELISDLGGGKTAFVRGVVAGIGSTDEVSSPSFTINNSYSGGRFWVEHFDFYRLEDPGVLKSELAEDIYKHDSVTLIEWGDSIVDVLPDARIIVDIKVRSDDTRLFTIQYTDNLSYLFVGAEK
jgi:tRNA threonylcarbamoyladenosine biosynthesis protein TsaE